MHEKPIGQIGADVIHFVGSRAYSPCGARAGRLLYSKGVVMLSPRLKLAVAQTRRTAKRFLADENGPTAVEYAILLAVLLLVAVGGISVLGRKNSKIWQAVGDAMGAVL